MAEGNSIALGEGRRRGTSPLLAVAPGLRDLATGSKTLGGFLLFILVFLLVVLFTSLDELAVVLLL